MNIALHVATMNSDMRFMMINSNYPPFMGVFARTKVAVDDTCLVINLLTQAHNTPGLNQRIIWSMKEQIQ